MPEDNGNTNVAELWRSWLTETERQLNSFFAEVLGTDSFGRFMGDYLEAYAAVQRSLNQGMERYLNTFNLPTHSDVIEVGERLRAIEERLASLEATISSLAAAAGLSSAAPVTRLRPRRTRRPNPQSSGND